MLQSVAVLGLSGLLAAGCASHGSNQTVTRYTDPTDPEAMSCRQVIKTGTRIGTRECRKNREWAADAERGRSFVENIQRSANMGAQPADPGGPGF